MGALGDTRQLHVGAFDAAQQQAHPGPLNDGRVRRIHLRVSDLADASRGAAPEHRVVTVAPASGIGVGQLPERQVAPAFEEVAVGNEDRPGVGGAEADDPRSAFLAVG